MHSAKGFSKTPDVLLTAPIGLFDSFGRMRTVHWIDSKGTFGDRVTHEGEVSVQLSGYVNRFGPGAVIYWFDYVDVLELASPNVLVLREMPTEFVTITEGHVSTRIPL